MIFKGLTLAMMLAGLATSARADGAAADACAAKLKPDGKTIYAAVRAANPMTDNLRSVVGQQTWILAMAGRIDRAGNPYDNASAVGECMKLGLQ